MTDEIKVDTPEATPTEDTGTTDAPKEGVDEETKA